MRSVLILLLASAASTASAQPTIRFPNAPAAGTRPPILRLPQRPTTEMQAPQQPPSQVDLSRATADPGRISTGYGGSYQIVTGRSSAMELYRGDGQPLNDAATAVARCPPGLQAVGGGFFGTARVRGGPQSSPPAEPGPSASEPPPSSGGFVWPSFSFPQIPGLSPSPPAGSTPSGIPLPEGYQPPPEPAGPAVGSTVNLPVVAIASAPLADGSGWTSSGTPPTGRAVQQSWERQQPHLGSWRMNAVAVCVRFPG